jgi:hypothetical protein
MLRHTLVHSSCTANCYLSLLPMLASLGKRSQLKKVVFWDVTTFGSCKNRVVFLRSLRRLLVTANVPSSPIVFTLMMETLGSSETSVITKAK